MHAMHFDRRTLLAGIAALALAASLAAAPSLDEVSFGGSGSGAAPAQTTVPDRTPAWVADPMAPPLLLQSDRR